MTLKADVLDKGYVQLARISANIKENDGQLSLSLTDDAFIANDARVSVGREVESVGPKEEKLIAFLEREGHSAPFRGAVMTFRIKAPLFVARQWFKYAVGSDHDESIAVRDPFFSWSEESRRYVESEPEFYIPEVWRSAPEKRMQGSGEPLGELHGQYLSGLLMGFTDRGKQLYESTMSQGACAEQARLFLPAYAMYTTWMWTCSVQGCQHFLRQRLAHGAQEEIRQYADAVLAIARQFYPLAMKEFGDE